MSVVFLAMHVTLTSRYARRQGTVTSRTQDDRILRPYSMDEASQAANTSGATLSPREHVRHDGRREKWAEEDTDFSQRSASPPPTMKTSPVPKPLTTAGSTSRHFKLATSKGSSQTGNLHHLYVNKRDTYTLDPEPQTAPPSPTSETIPSTYRGGFPVDSLQNLDLNKRYVKHRMMGRLGNIMFQLASCYCVAQRYNFSLIFSYRKGVEDLAYLKTKSVTVLSLKKYKTLHGALVPTKRAWEKACCTFNSQVLALSPNTSYGMRGYMQSWKYFEPCKASIPRVVAFGEDVTLQAESTVQTLRANYPNRTLVGIHIRMEDQTRMRDFSKGRRTAPSEYYVKAMTYFEARFADVTFLALASNTSQEWFRTNVNTTSHVTFFNRSECAPVDMEVLSRLDHLIITVGTFGWWAAYNSRGTVVCFKDFFLPGSRFGDQFGNQGQDYLYPGWVAL